MSWEIVFMTKIIFPRSPRSKPGPLVFIHRPAEGVPAYLFHRLDGMLVISTVIRTLHQSKENPPRITEWWKMMTCLFHAQLSLQEAVLPTILQRSTAMVNSAVCNTGQFLLDYADRI